MIELITSLMMHGVSSRVLVNGQLSKPFYRTQGILQGSPLSSLLFNLFLDPLLHTINPTADRIPTGLFFADDGVPLPPLGTDVPGLLHQVEQWATAHHLRLHVNKCGVLTSRPRPTGYTLYGEPLPLVPSYGYLGFPMTSRGIDFSEHLRRRIETSIGRSRWLSLFSDAWGPAHRLRIYQQFLAPMFEYGAPLVWAWAIESVANRPAFRAATPEHKRLLH